MLKLLVSLKLVFLSLIILYCIKSMSNLHPYTVFFNVVVREIPFNVDPYCISKLLYAYGAQATCICKFLLVFRESNAEFALSYLGGQFTYE